MKRLLLILSIVIAGCGESTPSDPAAAPQPHRFTFNNQIWQLSVPGTWEILSPESGALFMARNGDENIVILPREARSSDLAAQIIGSAEAQFFKFELQEKSDTAWQFLGQPSLSNPPRLFWQQVQQVPNTNQFLLASCSRHQANPDPTQCPNILRSWKGVE